MRSYHAHLPAGENIYDNPNDANPSLVIPNPNVSGNIYPNAPLGTYKNLPLIMVFLFLLLQKRRTVTRTLSKKLRKNPQLFCTTHTEASC